MCTSTDICGTLPFAHGKNLNATEHTIIISSFYPFAQVFFKMADNRHLLNSIQNNKALFSSQTILMILVSNLWYEFPFSINYSLE